VKVKALIQKLKTYDPDTVVVVGGFDEAGYADVRTIKMVPVVRRGKSQAEILGEYEQPELEEKKSVKRVLWIDH